MIFIRILISSWVAGEKFQRYLLWLTFLWDFLLRILNTFLFWSSNHIGQSHIEAPTLEKRALRWQQLSGCERPDTRWLEKLEKPETCQEKLYAAACLGGLPVLLMGGGAHIESPPRCQQWWQYWINNKNLIEGDEDHDDVVLNSSHSNEDVTRMNFIHWCEKRCTVYIVHCTVYNAKPPKNRLYTQIVWQADGKLWLSSSGCNPLWGAWKRSRPGRHQGWAPESRDLLKN